MSESQARQEKAQKASAAFEEAQAQELSLKGLSDQAFGAWQFTIATSDKAHDAAAKAIQTASVAKAAVKQAGAVHAAIEKAVSELSAKVSQLKQAAEAADLDLAIHLGNSDQQ